MYVPRPNIGMTTPSFSVIVEESPVGICTVDDIIVNILRNKQSKITTAGFHDLLISSSGNNKNANKSKNLIKKIYQI